MNSAYNIARKIESRSRLFSLIPINNHKKYSLIQRIHDEAEEIISSGINLENIYIDQYDPIYQFCYLKGFVYVPFYAKFLQHYIPSAECQAEAMEVYLKKKDYENFLMNADCLL